ncbi:alanyl-tRNA editing protein [Bacillus sp. FJAT-29790]|uniref:alanyl-tRNA editing protein n=1 Tax=Bacillus sp. FJAT-29790 TaxID=1895002 RepID=UPI001C211526|nr:alanyl-tRNA editing protein [Bacillus sp. FJAT-29790]MBU8879923.1 alanyl-tRNA editing protein [Bacillus sp. FJAT-29790]
MDNKLYYKDSYIKSFSANLLRQDKDEQGKWYAVLEETAFYPTGGGQPHDTGILNGVKVIEVEEVEGEIRHYLEEPVKESLILGEVDWDRRFDHMQQHAGQHILSAAFEELFGFTTVSFHLGKELITIDLDIEELTEQQAQKVEELANQIIMENRPIDTIWVTANELSEYPLRKQPSVTEDIRLVIIPEFDYNGCGGTHPYTTAEVGAIKILDWERQRKRIRIHFVCGSRVLAQLHQKQNAIKKLSQLLNAPEQDLDTAAKRLIDNGRELEKSLEDLREELIGYEAIELLEKAVPSDRGKIVGKVFQNRSVQELQKLARTITNQSEEVIVFLVNEADEKLQFVCSRGTIPTISMKQITGALLPLINGKGGGSDLFSQGGGEALLTGEQLLLQALELTKQEIK